MNSNHSESSGEPRSTRRGQPVRKLSPKLVALLGIVAGCGLASLALADSEPAAPPHATPPEVQPVRLLVMNPAPPSAGRQFDSLPVLHAAHVREFQSTPGFGMSRVMVMPTASELFLGEFAFAVPKPDLIALEADPVAYRSTGEMVSMAALTNGLVRTRLQKRPLSDTETKAVEMLRHGQDQVVLPAIFQSLAQDLANRESLVKTNHVAGKLVVGALRANADCARCHGCEEGTLLGAFSYALIPTGTRPLLEKLNPLAAVPASSSDAIPQAPGGSE